MATGGHMCIHVCVYVSVYIYIYTHTYIHNYAYILYYVTGGKHNVICICPFIQDSTELDVSMSGIVSVWITD